MKEELLSLTINSAAGCFYQRLFSTRYTLQLIPVVCRETELTEITEITEKFEQFEHANLIYLLLIYSIYLIYLLSTYYLLIIYLLDLLIILHFIIRESEKTDTPYLLQEDIPYSTAHLVV